MNSSIQAADLFRVDGLVAVVTGGGSGIGLMIANALASNGASKVYIIGRRLEALEHAAQKAPGTIIPLQGDVTSKNDLVRIAERIESEVGHLDLLVANAGVSGPDLTGLPPSPSFSDIRGKLWEPTFDDFSRTYAINSAATFFTVVAFLELLDKGNQANQGIKKQRSQVIATSSISGFNRNVPGGFAYGGSKAASTHMMKQFATLLAPWGIRSNVIAPGIYPSEMTSANMSRKQEEVTENFSSSIIPENRMGDEQDIAGAILFLASAAGSYLNGTVLVTDGGRLSITPASY